MNKILALAFLLAGAMVGINAKAVDDAWGTHTFKITKISHGNTGGSFNFGGNTGGLTEWGSSNTGGLGGWGSSNTGGLGGWGSSNTGGLTGWGSGNNVRLTGWPSGNNGGLTNLGNGNTRSNNGGKQQRKQKPKKPRKTKQPKSSGRAGGAGGAGGSVQSACVADANSYRRRHQRTGDLVWDSRLAKEAQRYANKLARRGFNLIHDPNTNDGENLFNAANSEPLADKEQLCRDANAKWYAEIKDWSFRASRGTGGVTGHFTQMVWRDSKRVGFGIATGRSGGMNWVVVVARYSPRGNFVTPNSGYRENVMPLKGRGDEEETEIL